MVNTSNLTKYIPGKVWSYALQMYWMEKEGFPKSLVLFVNLMNLYISLIAALILGLVFLVFLPGKFPLTVTVPLLIGLTGFEMVFLVFNSPIVNGLLSMINRIFKRDIKYFETSPKLISYLHVIYFAAAFSFGMGAWLLCFGIGFDVATGRMLSVMSAMMISEVAGFLAFIAPGGLGVREGVMYLLLRGAPSGALIFILPFATRIMSMLVDVILGALGLALLKNYRIQRDADHNA
jgi:hypothetical protein